MGTKKAGVQMPADLASLSDDQLAALLSDVTAEFDSVIDDSESDPDVRLTRASELADMNDAIVTHQGERQTLAAEREAQAEALRARMHPAAEEVEEVETSDVPLEAEVPVAVAASGGATTRARGQDLSTRLTNGERLPAAPRKLNPTLADIQANAPRVDGSVRRNSRESVLVASADIPGVPMGSTLSDVDALVAAIQHRARTLPVAAKGLQETTWYPVAGLKLDHKYMLGMNSTHDEIDEVLQAAANPDALVAAGGWCSPSEISYDFYNIVCEDGMLDLPSVGINRGGMRWPTSPSYGDINQASTFWTWNETQDVAAVTGTAQSGTKTCVRVPCPAFNEARLHCDGLCLTVGNLMEDAYPENIANYTRLLFASQAHNLNAKRINELLLPANSVAITGFGAAGAGLVAPVLGSLELSAIDYREKFAMCENSILEVVLPRWLRGAMRSDLRKRMGGNLEMLSVTDAQLMNMFDLLDIRVQWVSDWQARSTGFPGASTPITVWPTAVQFLMFAAGTFVWGRGLQLNLGVIRDSVLNATNDHTAEWMEECWLIAKIGHESRLGTIAICPDGTTGAADLTACGV